MLLIVVLTSSESLDAQIKYAPNMIRIRLSIKLIAPEPCDGAFQDFAKWCLVFLSTCTESRNPQIKHLEIILFNSKWPLHVSNGGKLKKSKWFIVCYNVSIHIWIVDCIIIHAVYATCDFRRLWIADRSRGIRLDSIVVESVLFVILTNFEPEMISV